MQIEYFWQQLCIYKECEWIQSLQSDNIIFLKIGKKGICFFLFTQGSIHGCLLILTKFGTRPHTAVPHENRTGYIDEWLAAISPHLVWHKAIVRVASSVKL